MQPIRAFGNVKVASGAGRLVAGGRSQSGRCLWRTQAGASPSDAALAPICIRMDWPAHTGKLWVVGKLNLSLSRAM